MLNAIIQALQNRGNEVSLLVLPIANYGSVIEERRIIQKLALNGIEVKMLPRQENKTSSGRLWRMLLPPMEQLFSDFKRRKEVTEFINDKNPAVLLLAGWNAIASQHDVQLAPKLGIVADHAHLPTLFRERLYKNQENSKRGLKPLLKSLLFAMIHTPRIRNHMTDLLNGCEINGSVAAHHAADHNSHGVRNCQYIRPPMPDPLLTIKKIEKSKKFKIMLIGDLRGTATLSGIKLLAEEIFPFLRSHLPRESFQLDIIGNAFETMPQRFKKLLNHPEINFRGFVDSVDEEFLSSHLVLVPTPIELGMRVRILTALSFGSCIVAHEANRKGTPELVSGKNCLLGSDGPTIAQHCIKLYHDSSLRQALQNEARTTYDTHFSIATAGIDLCRVIEKLGSANTATYSS